MYYIVFAILYILSLLPWWVMHILSKGIAFYLYRIKKYRREVVWENITNSFPHKSDIEKEIIIKEFYLSFTQNFISIIKLLSISKRSFLKRFTGNIEVVTDLLQKGKSVQCMTGHFFNWEYFNIGVSYGVYPLGYQVVSIYMPQSSAIFDRLMLYIRSKSNAILISLWKFGTTFKEFNKQIVVGVIMDQSPRHTEKLYWLPLLNQMTAFTQGSEKLSRIRNYAVCFVYIRPGKKIGYYHYEFTLICEDPNSMPRGHITQQCVQYLNDYIQKYPSNYLWSHRRWKMQYNVTLHKRDTIT